MIGILLVQAFLLVYLTYPRQKKISKKAQKRAKTQITVL